MRYTNFLRTHTKANGFTIVELMVVMAMLMILFGLTSINLGNPQVTTSVDNTVETLLADIKGQQLLAMSGGQGSTASQQPQGIYIQPSSYTLFAGTTYNAGDGNNFTVNSEQGITLSTTFPNSRIVFNKGTGDVSGFVNGSNTITVVMSGSSKTITINRLGAMAVN